MSTYSNRTYITTQMAPGVLNSPSYFTQVRVAENAFDSSSRRRRPSDLKSNPTAYKHESAHQEYGWVILSERPGTYASWSTYAPSSYGIYALPNASSASNSALVKFRSQIKDQKLNLGQLVAELPSTGRMVADAATSLYRAFRDLRRGYPADAIRRLLDPKSSSYSKAAANRWLSIQYGYKPLLADIYGASEVLADKLYGPSHWSRFVSASGYDEQSGLYSSGQARIAYTKRAKVTYRGEIVVGLEEKPSFQLTQVGLTNPLALAWELIPYSFVADWLFNCGDWINGLDALHGVRSYRYYTVTRSSATFDMYYVPPLSRQLTSHSELKLYDRTAPASSGLSFGHVAYEPSKSFAAVANGLALLQQIRKRHYASNHRSFDH